MQAIWNELVIADCDETIELGGYTYFPRDTVRMDLLQAAPRTADDNECPHGVRFYDIVSGATRSERAAWSYEAPQAPLQRIDHWIGFWGDVAVQ